MRSASRNRATWDPQTDRYWGPFTYNKATGSYHPIAFMLSSAGDDDEESRCNLRMSGLGRTLIVSLPPILRPWRQWVDTSRYGWSDNPAGGYWALHRREFGISISRSGGGDNAYDYLSLHLGPQTNDSTTTRSKGWFLPWASWRHVRRSFYGLDGEHVWSEFDSRPKGLDRDARLEWHRAKMDAARAAEEACPSRTFAFADFDGEELTARTHIEEREWRLGEGRFKWLSLFRKPMIVRRLDITFSGETGRRKGSWKGGTISTNGPIMQPGEMHEAAFRRYCAENKMRFLGEVAPPPSPSV